jgi:hypothetical protein
MKAPTFAPVFAYFYPVMCEAARSLGYALAVHGTMDKDLDLIAVPWIDNACAPLTLVRTLANVAGGTLFESAGHTPEEKPHGREAWLLILNNGAAVDLSIMPRLSR